MGSAAPVVSSVAGAFSKDKTLRKVSSLTPLGAVAGVGRDVMNALNQKPPTPQAGPQAPTREEANDAGLAAIRAKLSRNRTYRTLFTGGQGAIGAASTASSTLLGI